MEIINNVTQDEIEKAAKALRGGHLVTFPTETVYGLGADATNEKAVAKIYSVKGRPTDHPLIVHISSIKQLGKWAIDIPEYAIKLAEEFWPGPMTLILKRSGIAKDFITGGQENVGVRVPSHPVALELLSSFEKIGGVGIAAPSANRFGAVSPTSAEAVDEELAAYLTSEDLLLDGGQSKIGIESTIIDCTVGSQRILRPGAVTIEMVNNAIKSTSHLESKLNEIRVSGLLEKHYSPRAKVTLGNIAEPGDGFIAMSSVKTPEGAIRLAAPKTIDEYASVIYKSLREADRLRISKVVVTCPEGSGLAVAVRDRLNRASSSHS